MLPHNVTDRDYPVGSAPRVSDAGNGRSLRSLLIAISCTLAMVFGVLGAGNPAVSWADDRDDLQHKREQAEKDKARLESSLEGVNTDLQSSYIELETLRGEITVAEGTLAQAEAELAAAQREQASLEGRIEVAQADLDAIEGELIATRTTMNNAANALGELARSTYRGELSTSAIDVALGAADTNDFLVSYARSETISRTQSATLAHVQSTAAKARNQQARANAAKERLAELKAEADRQVEKTEQAAATAKANRDKLTTLHAQQRQLTDQLESKRDQFQADISRREADIRDFSAQIAKIDRENQLRRQREEAARKAAERKAAQEKADRDKNRAPAPAKPNPKPAKPAPAPSTSGGMLIPPVTKPLYVTSPYGMRHYPFGGYWMHNGVDLRSACGNSQVAAAAGTVVATKPARGNGTHGNQVIINHGILSDGNSYITVYNHLSAFAVSPGQRVSQGQMIGRTGATGRVTGCHVHFEVWRNGSTINPMGIPGFR